MNEFLRKLARIGRPIGRPIAGRTWLPMFAVIRFRGRKSGRAYEVPIAIRPTGDGFIVPVPFGGSQWVRNVLAQGGATLRWRGRDVEVTRPRLVDATEGMPAFNRVQRPLLRVFGIVSFLRLSRAEEVGGPPEVRAR